MTAIVLAATAAVVMVVNSTKCRDGTNYVVVGLKRICKSETYT